jgi:hypothetical protein
MEHKQYNVSESEHPEWSVQNSLSSPLDRTQEKLPLTKGIILTETEVENAMDELNVKSLKKFPRIEKFYADPEMRNQRICLHSFVPSKGATPDKSGVYGFVKVRGVFATEQEANDKAEELIRNVDSFHSIYHSYIGRPFPLSFNKNFVETVKEVELVEKTIQTISEDIKGKREKDRKEMEEIKEREKKLLESSKEEKEDPFDEYTTMQVKKAQLCWTYTETLKKMDQMKKSIISTRKLIQEREEQNSEYKDKYMEKYKNARKEAGLPETDDSFMKYMGEDIDVGF